jgi:hypothetical protein
MIEALRLRNWIAITMVAFAGIVGFLVVSKYLASKNIPVVSPIAAGVGNVWTAAAA